MTSLLTTWSVKHEIEASALTYVGPTVHYEELSVSRYQSPVGVVIDLIIGSGLTVRDACALRDLERELGHPLSSLVVERQEFSRPHPQLLASNKFLFVRICKAVAPDEQR